MLLGGLYAAQLRIDHAGLDGYASIFAAGLVVTAELAYWSLEERARIETESGEMARRLAVVALLGVASALVAEALLALAGVVRANGLPVDLLGTGAAAAVLLTVVVLVRRRAPAA